MRGRRIIWEETKEMSNILATLEAYQIILALSRSFYKQEKLIAHINFWK
jgi:hypothetical protein